MPLLLALLLISLAASLSAQPRSRTDISTFARRPYMGWSSWSFFRSKPSEAAIKAQVDALFAAGLPQLGYRYINIDSRWTDGFDDSGIPKPDLVTFPSGMSGMAAYLHSRGLRLGLYLSPGIEPQLYQANPRIKGTSAYIRDITITTEPGATRRGLYKIDFSKPAARVYVQSIVNQFARWGVDFIKLDFVGPGGGNLPADNREEVRQWHAAIQHSGRPIWLELSNYLSIDQAPLWRETANGWRIEDDIECYRCGHSSDPKIKGNLTEWSRVASRFNDVRAWIPYAHSGGWNDLDSLELGNGDRDGITPPERQSMFILWAISCAPLYLGTDLTHMDSADLALISNRDIIAIDQRGIPARPLDIQNLRKGPGQAWMNLYPDGSAVLALFNLGPDATTIHFDWREVDALRNTSFARHPPELTDLISHSRVESSAEGINLPLDSHASRIFRLTMSH